ncbi:MAG: hypothetical protein PHV32_01105 [Eubacteriales bacterium]|nr:hypothetical protein [Eubacteriales bacterium]
MKETDTRITARVTPKEKTQVVALAEKCGLPQTEYIRQRALGYEPKAVPPDAFFYFCEKLDEFAEKQSSAELTAQALELLKEMYKEFILPGKEDTRKWRPQASGQSKES